jgi:hypothetical protein
LPPRGVSASSANRRPRGIVQTFSIVAAIAAAAQAAALIALHLLPTGYNPKVDAVSDYGIGRYRAVFWTQTLAGAVACVALAIALGDAKPSMPGLVIALLVVAGIARLLIRSFRLTRTATGFRPCTARSTWSWRS